MTSERKGVRGIYNFMRGMIESMRMRRSRPLPALEHYPAGAGGAYWESASERFRVPGEKGGAAEPILFTMRARVSGYGQTEESPSACFSAGFQRRDPWLFVFLSCCNHVGIRMTPITKARTDSSTRRRR